MKMYVMAAAAAAALTWSPAAQATTYLVGSPNFQITNGTPFTPSITAYFFASFSASGAFDDSFQFTIPQNGVGSGSISTSFSNSAANLLTITTLLINGVPYPLVGQPGGQSASVNNIPITAFALNTIRVIGTVTGTGVYSGTATFNATAIPEPASWALMLGGFGIIGAAMRRTTRRVAFS